MRVWQNEAKIMKYFKRDQHATNGCIRVTELTEDARTGDLQPSMVSIRIAGAFGRTKPPHE
jgi:hypothetical protein